MAVQVSKSSGMYNEISGDYSQLQKDLRGAVTIGKAMGKEISDVLFSMLTPKSAVSASGNLTKYLATAQCSAKAH